MLDKYLILLYRCHLWMVQDQIPYEEDKFIQRVYEFRSLINNACKICLAKKSPYHKREPCDAEMHLSQCKLTNCSAGGKGSKKFYCQDCWNSRNFQCGFCFKKFFTSGMAEVHIEKCHQFDTLDDFKCDICELEDDFHAIAPQNRISNKALPHWINNQLQMRRLEKQEELQHVNEEDEEDESEKNAVEDGDVDFSDKNIYDAEFPILVEEQLEEWTEEEEKTVNQKSLYADVV